MSATLESKMRDLSAVAMVAIVLIHSISLLTFPAASRWNVFVQRLITRNLTCWAVPYFFVVSGYWCSRKLVGSRVSQFYYGKIQSLVIPYVLWCLLGVAFVLPLIMAVNIANGNMVFTNTEFEGFSAWGWINGIFGICRNGPKSFGHLWFLRSLIMMVVSAPIAVNISKSRFGVMLLGLVSGVLLFQPRFEVKALSIQFVWFGWFFLGILVRRLKLEMKAVPKWFALILSGAFLATTLAFQRREAELLGILAVWFLYDQFPMLFSWSRKVIGDQFWVYCFHIVPCSYYMALVLFIAGKNDYTTFFTFITCPFVTLAVSYAVGRLCKRHLSSFYTILVGGRS